MLNEIPHHDYAEAIKISESISPLLAGRGQFVQMVILADLVSKWLTGHWDTYEIGLPFGRHPDTDLLRGHILSLFVSMVQDLVEPNEAMMSASKD
jgi:hypothetical protein